MRSKLIEVARWIAVLPAAFAAAYIAYAVAGSLGHLYFDWLSREGPGRWARHILWSTPRGMAFVIAGAGMAPRSRRATAIALAILAVAQTALIHGVIRDGLGGDLLPVIVEAGAVAVGVAFIFYSERPERGTQAQGLSPIGEPTE